MFKIQNIDNCYEDQDLNNFSHTKSVHADFPKGLDRWVWANSEDRDQTAPREAV